MRIHFATTANVEVGNEILALLKCATTFIPLRNIFRSTDPAPHMIVMDEVGKTYFMLCLTALAL